MFSKLKQDKMKIINQLDNTEKESFEVKIEVK